MQDEWQRLDEVVTVLTTATSWAMVCDTLQVLLAPQATIYRLSHRGRKLTTGRPGEGFWISHEPRLRQALLAMAPVHLPDGPTTGWWIPWASGALHLSAEQALPPRWLLTVAHLLSQYPRLPSPGTSRGEDVKALRQLNELSWIIHGTPDLESLLRDLPAHLGRHLGLSHCALLRLDAEQGQGMVIGGWEMGVSRPMWADLAFERHSPLGAVLWDAPAGRWRQESGTDDWRCARATELLAHGDALLAPLNAFGARWGLLLVRHPRPRSQRLGRVLAATADHVAIALAIRTQGAAGEMRRQQAEALFRSAPTPLALLDGEGAILEPNLAAQVLLGAALAPQTPFYQLVAAPDRQRLRDAWLDLESGRAVRIPGVDLLPSDAGGSLRHLACNLAPLTDAPAQASLSRAVLSLCDHSGLVQQIRSQDTTLRLWESLAMALPMPMALVDRTHRVIWAPAVPGPDPGRPSCCHPLFQDPNGGACAAALALGQGVTRRMTAANGLITQVWPVWDADRRVIGAVAMRDDGGPSALGDTAGWAIVGRLLDAVRHDLHNPLGVISGRAEALRLDGVASPHIEAIDRAVDRLVEILQTLATWRPRPATTRTLDVVETAYATLAGLQAMARAVGQGWTIVATDSPLLAMASPVVLQAFLTAVMLLAGRSKGPRDLRLVCHGDPGWIYLTVEGALDLPPLGADGQDLLLALAGETLVEGAIPTWRVPRWPC